MRRFTFQLPFSRHEAPVLYLVAALPAALILVYTLARKRDWRRIELAWWILPLALTGSVLAGVGPPWSFRELVSWMLRGFFLGGMLLAWGSAAPPLYEALRRILWVAVAAAGIGLAEKAWDRNPLYDGLTRPQASEPLDSRNPLYRPQTIPDLSFSGRPRGTQENRIVYTACLVPFVPLAVWLARGSRALAGFPVLGCLALGGLLLVSETRSAWVGLAASLGAYAFLSWKGRRGFLAVLVFGGVSLALLTFVSSEFLRGRIDAGTFLDPAIQHRLKSLAVVKALEGRWLLGVGYGQYPQVYLAHYRGPYSYLATPDNQYFRWLIETGIVGSAALAYFLCAICLKGFRAAAMLEDIRLSELYRALLAGWIGIAVTFLFFDGFYWGASNATFWCFLGLFATCLKGSSLTSRTK